MFLLRGLVGQDCEACVCIHIYIYVYVYLCVWVWGCRQVKEAQCYELANRVHLALVRVFLNFSP